MGKSQCCYLCQGKNFNIRPGKVRDNPDLKIYECTSCGLVFLSTLEHIDKYFYESANMHKDAPDMDLESWIKNTARDDERRYNQLLPLIKNKKVLDFGCGNGGFLKLARNAALDCAGVEVEARLKTYFAKNNLSVYSNIKLVDGNFDIITLFHVLEHIPDPINLLKRLSKKLEKDGRIIIEVPNANDALLSLYESEPFSLFTYWSPHLYLFSNVTLKAIGERAGLEEDYIKQIQRYPLSNHLFWLAKGKPGGHEKWNFLDSPELNTAYEKQLSIIGCCDTIFASFSNPSLDR